MSDAYIAFGVCIVWGDALQYNQGHENLRVHLARRPGCAHCPTWGTPCRVEDVCFGRALVQRTKSAGANPVYYVLGQTAAGRYLFCVVIQFPDGKGFPVTARPMTRKEQRRFNQWKNR